MKSLNDFNFIKSYPVLRKLPITKLDKELIELVLSYQANNLTFFMKYTSIAQELCVKYQSVKNIISKLKKLGYLITNHSSHYNGIQGGSSTTLSVNTYLIEQQLEQLNLTVNNLDVNKELENFEDVKIDDSDFGFNYDIENDGFSSPELAKEIAVLMAKKNTNPAQKKKEFIPTTNEPITDFSVEDDSVSIDELKNEITKTEEFVTVKPKNTNISIPDYFTQIKKKYDNYDVHNTLDYIANSLNNYFNITMYDDEQMKKKEMKDYYNKEIKVFDNDKYKYLQLF